MLFGGGICLVLAQKFAFKATSNLPVPATAPLQFIGLLMQCACDLFIFNLSFEALQVIGIAIVILVYISQLLFWLYCSKPKEVIDPANEVKDSEVGNQFPKQILIK